MKSSQPASEWPAAARNLRSRNSWIHYCSVLNSQRYTRSPVNNSAGRPSLRSPINADPTEPGFRGFIGSPIVPTDLEACRDGEKDAARCSKPSEARSRAQGRLCPCERRPRACRKSHGELIDANDRRSGLGLTMASWVVSRARVPRAHGRRGTEGSNPSPSSGESRANLTSSIRVDPGRPILAPKKAARLYLRARAGRAPLCRLLGTR
jgi:hypothetical protein